MQISRFDAKLPQRTQDSINTRHNGQAQTSIQATGTPAQAPREIERPIRALPGEVVHLSSSEKSEDATPVYSKSGNSIRHSFDLNTMTLEQQLALGKQQGIFTKITIGKDDILHTERTPPGNFQAQAFVNAAVTTMRDFQEGIATLSETTTPHSRAHDLLAYGLRNLQHVANKLKVSA